MPRNRAGLVLRTQFPVRLQDGTPMSIEGLGGPTFGDFLDHSARHENGGPDEISVAGLSGLLADAQTPLAHVHPESDITGLVADLAAKQATLVSGTNIKTINSASILGAGDLVIAGAGDVVGPAGAIDDRIAIFDGATGKLISDGGQTIAQAIAAAVAASGDVVGPFGVVDQQIAVFKGTTGKLIDIPDAVSQTIPQVIAAAVTAAEASIIPIGLTTEVSGILPVTNGGTGVATLAANGVLYGNVAGVVLVTAQGAANTVLVANAGAPSFSAAVTIGTSVTSPSLVATTTVTAPAIVTAAGALTITPAAGSNLNVALSTTGDFAVNTNDLYVDTSAGAVGINTTAPLSALSINGGLHVGGNSDAGDNNAIIDGTLHVEGVITCNGFGAFNFLGSGTGINVLQFLNATAGATNEGVIGSGSDAVTTRLGSTASSFTATGVKPQRGAYLFSDGLGGLSIAATDSAGEIRFYTGGTTERARLDILGNIGIGATAFGASAAKVIGVSNGTEPSTSPADMVQLYSVDLSAGNATLGLRTETVVVTEAVISDRTLPIRINGTTYKICLKV